MKRGEEEVLISDLLEEFESIGLAHILHDAAKKCHVSKFQILGRSREHSAVRARREVIRRLYVEAHKSTPEIGRLFDIDHTTVLHALNRARVQKMPGRGPGWWEQPGDKSSETGFVTRETTSDSRIDIAVSSFRNPDSESCEKKEGRPGLATSRPITPEETEVNETVTAAGAGCKANDCAGVA